MGGERGRGQSRGSEVGERARQGKAALCLGRGWAELFQETA